MPTMQLPQWRNQSLGPPAQYERNSLHLLDLSVMKKILILGAGQEQCLAIFEAKALGYFVIACDEDPHAVGFASADISHVIDIQNENEVTRVAKDHSVDGVFAHAVEIPHIIANVATSLDLPCLLPEVAVRATNKKLRIAHLKDSGIPCANFCSVETKGQLEGAAKELGFPLIIKPVDNAGSRGVSLVFNKSELEKAYAEAIRYSRAGGVLLEERLSGPEISTESVVYKDEIYTFAFADRNYARPELFSPYFVEDGINFPTVLSVGVQKAVYDLVERTIRVLGINFGAAKGDIIIDKGVPKIIEMAARTSGGWFGAGSIPAATGVNMLKPLLQMAVGDEPDLDLLKPMRHLGCAQRYIIPTESGVVRSITGVEEAQSMPGVVMSTMFLPKIGSAIRRATNHAERYGQIICTGSTREKAMQRCDDAIRAIRIELDDR